MFVQIPEKHSTFSRGLPFPSSYTVPAHCES